MYITTSASQYPGSSQRTRCSVFSSVDTLASSRCTCNTAPTGTREPLRDPRPNRSQTPATTTCSPGTAPGGLLPVDREEFTEDPACVLRDEACDRSEGAAASLRMVPAGLESWVLRSIRGLARDRELAATAGGVCTPCDGSSRTSPGTNSEICRKACSTWSSCSWSHSLLALASASSRTFSAAARPTRRALKSCSTAPSCSAS
mmetsp:Transcript_39308/g.88335  ORF Transcript_39308/g.88335 Transcript_39308/m.88335 type:complete len:203 (-) Transcript_39308:1098-1706(-)